MQAIKNEDLQVSSLSPYFTFSDPCILMFSGKENDWIEPKSSISIVGIYSLDKSTGFLMMSSHTSSTALDSLSFPTTSLVPASPFYWPLPLLKRRLLYIHVITMHTCVLYMHTHIWMLYIFHIWEKLVMYVFLHLGYFSIMDSSSIFFLQMTQCNFSLKLNKIKVVHVCVCVCLPTCHIFLIHLSVDSRWGCRVVVVINTICGYLCSMMTQIPSLIHLGVSASKTNSGLGTVAQCYFQQLCAQSSCACLCTYAQTHIHTHFRQSLYAIITES